MKTLKRILPRLGASLALLVFVAPLWSAAVTWKARELKWADNATIKGAKLAAVGHGGTFHRLPINQVLAGGDAAQDARVVVLLGSISVEIDGKALGEYGPGAYVAVPARGKYTFTATAAGECTFFVQHAPPSGSAGVTWKARELKWTDSAAIKGAKLATVGDGGAFHRLLINQVLAGGDAARDALVVVLLGSISAEIEGEIAGEYGPGAYVAVPAGSEYTLTATAAGECTFLLQQAPVVQSAVLP